MQGRCDKDHATTGGYGALILPRVAGYQSRAYRDDDRTALLDLVTAANADPAGTPYRHVGDVLWQMFLGMTFDPAANIRLWEGDDRALRGFVWRDAPGAAVIQAHPAWDGDTPLVAAMLAWATAHWSIGGADGAGHTLRTYARDRDLSRGDLLARRGFRPAGEHSMLLLERSLRDPLPAALPLPDAMARPVREDELARSVALHRAVRANSVMTEGSYRRMRGVAGFRPDLDLVVALPDGALAAYCICWLDPINRTGLFEPVGTGAAYRRRGFGRTVIHEGLQRLRKAGAHTAMVCCTASNDPARALYESAGFRVVDRECAYDAAGA